MAQAYNIYLNKRLTEFDIIIKNLPLRDGLVAHTKMYLDAMVNYLYLQKFIIGEHEMALQARIDDLLEEVFNKFGNKMALDVKAEVFAEKPIFGSTEMFLNTAELPINEECFNEFSEFMSLTTKALDYELSKSLGTGRSGMILNTHTVDTLKEAFERFINKVELSTSATPSSEKFAESTTDMVLQTKPFDIFYLLTIQCEAVMNLLCSADLELWYTLGEAKGQLVLITHNSSVQSEKFCDMSILQQLLSEVNATLIYFLNSEGIKICLSASASAGLMRYRRLEEIDPLTLGDIDEMTLEELDYVVLA
ncbi:MAG: hypothetical protein NC548_44050 [Lachnospiraceae bacterium]|nr:hypothetical protein [Lachnospiraceae bacterium]